MTSNDKLVSVSDWKLHAHRTEQGYYNLVTDDLWGIPVRLFLTPKLLREAENTLYRQIVNAARFPGVKMVAITPDTHYGYGVPVGCVILTDIKYGAVAMGPVGFDIGCGMMSAQSDVEAEKATPEKRRAFNQAVMERIEMGQGGRSVRLSNLDRPEFEELIRGGAEYYVRKYGARFDRSRAERHRIPIDGEWTVPWGRLGRPERGIAQLGSLGGGNHFIELQRSSKTGTLFVQVHTGSRGFGHGLATNYFELARTERPDKFQDIDLGYFTPESKHYQGYLNAVAAGGNFAILNRLVLFEEIAAAFKQVFRRNLELVYEISHNLVQKEWHPEFGEVWVHRKGATRAFPAGHPALLGTIWEKTGHPVLIPGSNKDFSYILRPLPQASVAGFSVNHGAGRQLSRGEARRQLSQKSIDAEYREAGILVNLDGRVPIDEAAPCYKSAKEVVQAVLDAGLAEVEHELWPLSSLKGADEKRDKNNRDKKNQSDRSKKGGQKGKGPGLGTDWRSYLIEAEAEPEAESYVESKSASDKDAAFPDGVDSPKGDPEPDPSSHHY